MIFTTAFDQCALQAFEVFSADYLLKPVESERLVKTLEKLEKNPPKIRIKRRQTSEKLLEDVARNLVKEDFKTLSRVASRIGGKVQIVDVKDFFGM